MTNFIRNMGLTGLVLGAISLSGCAEKTAERPESLQEIEVAPAVTEGPYTGMRYIILNEQIAREQGANKYIEIRERNSERKIKVTYEENGSVKSIEGNLPYLPEAIKQIMKKDIAFKSNFWIKIK